MCCPPGPAPAFSASRGALPLVSLSCLSRRGGAIPFALVPLSPSVLLKDHDLLSPIIALPRRT